MSRVSQEAFTEGKLMSDIGDLASEMAALKLENEQLRTDLKHERDNRDLLVASQIASTQDELAITEYENIDLKKRIAELEAKVERAEAALHDMFKATVGSIPESDDYANGWNDCRKKIYSRKRARLDEFQKEEALK
jgi:regulator of replication initiation timing